ncbi:FAD-binding oxidoreductase [Endozoicomonas sp.]|uniref:FAD-binding oxidoreductase n=1 Tax=Endozoicomonas sp. TaxID=1892382 RepID=UPI0028843428|nr:FAD-binding oxidoreductase [Endozoicomonas sp.]
MPVPLFPVTLSKKQQLSSNTLQLSFELVSGESDRFSFVAGQFIQLFLEVDGTLYKRSYSIANSPEDFNATGQIEVALSFVNEGIASEFFQKAEPGITINIAGPFGALILPETLPGQLVLVGTGTGIAPYRSMIPQLTVLADQGVSVTVVMGFRFRQESIYIDDFAKLSEVAHRICLSREADLHADQYEHAGYVQNQFESLNLNPEQDVIYLCGNPGMIDDCVTLLRDMGFPPRQIKREKYVYSGH